MEKTIETVKEILLRNKDLATIFDEVYKNNKDFRQIPLVTLVITVFAILDHVIEADQRINKVRTFLEKMRDFFIPKYKKEHRDKLEQKETVLQTLERVNKIVAFLLEIYQDPRTMGAPDQKKREDNERLLQELHTKTILGISEQITYWRLITLALLGDRPKPAELMVPQLREKMELKEFIVVHSFLGLV